MAAPVIEIQGLSKFYGEGDSQVRALDGVHLTVEQGEYVAIMGASGSGKSTMMNLLGCLDVATQGDYLINGINVRQMSENQLSAIRNRYIGFVFQSFNLIPRVSALSNVELPMAYAGVGQRERRARSQAALAMVGLSDRASHMPNELSGGQQQRVAVARSLVNAPALILADEPTGNLDSQSTADVLNIFDRLNAQGRTIVLITHENEVAERAQRVLRMKDGKIVFDSTNPESEAYPPAATITAPTITAPTIAAPTIAAPTITAPTAESPHEADLFDTAVFAADTTTRIPRAWTAQR